MTFSPDTTVLAVDGGGTRCRIAMSDGRARLDVEVGSVNVSTDFDAAREELLKGFGRVADQSGVSRDRLGELPVYLGLAGAVSDAIRDRLKAELPFENLRVEDDRPASVRASLGQRDGYVAHCGTGSFFAAQSGESVRLIGGWGPVLGDEASAQWLGRRALTVTLETVDGLCPPSPFVDALLDRFNGPAGVVAFASDASPSEFGGLAKLVTEHAKGDDPVANLVLQQGADQVSTILRRMGWTEGDTICLTGGLGPEYRVALPPDMAAAIATPLGEPLEGALSLAFAFRDEVRS